MQLGGAADVLLFESVWGQQQRRTQGTGGCTTGEATNNRAQGESRDGGAGVKALLCFESREFAACVGTCMEALAHDPRHRDCTASDLRYALASIARACSLSSPSYLSSPSSSLSSTLSSSLSISPSPQPQCRKAIVGDCGNEDIEELMSRSCCEAMDLVGVFASAVIVLAAIRYFGVGGIRPNSAEAAKLYSVAASSKQQHPVALFNLAVLTAMGDGVEKNNAAAKTLLESAAKQSHVGAQYHLAAIYYSERNFQGAIVLYTQAAAQGDDNALCSLARMYRRGDGVLKNVCLCAALLQRAAQQGNVDACIDLGQMYFIGEGVAKVNEKEALRLFRVAADQGNAGAQFNLALLHSRGEGGLVRDRREACKLYSLAAAQGHASAKVNLSQMTHYYTSGTVRGGAYVPHEKLVHAFYQSVQELRKSLPPSPLKVSAFIQSLQLAAQGGDGQALCKIATLHLIQNNGVIPYNPVLSAQLYSQASDLGHAPAQVLLGELFVHGGLDSAFAYDEARAARLFALATNKGETRGQANLGWMYLCGAGGLVVDLAEARQHLTSASRRGDMRANEGLRELDSLMS
ncbi:sel1 repeat family protein [Pelomyxa schiedti]|nr:sel1 repeat family protein [Pelomyxa schiedti]